MFYWKPKWSVWSISTYSTGYILKFVTPTVSLGRKLKQLRSQTSYNFSFGVPNGLLRVAPGPKSHLNIFRRHPKCPNFQILGKNRIFMFFRFFSFFFYMFPSLLSPLGGLLVIRMWVVHSLLIFGIASLSRKGRIRLDACKRVVVASEGVNVEPTGLSMILGCLQLPAVAGKFVAGLWQQF